MPPLLLALPAALAAGGLAWATGATIFGLTGLSAALAIGGISLALGTVANLLAPHSSVPQGNNVAQKIGPAASPFSCVPNQPRTWCYGRGATGGTIKFWTVSGTDNKFLSFVVVVHDTQCDAFETQYVNSQAITYSGGAATNIFIKGGSPLMWRTDYLGALSQTADATLITDSGSVWTTSHKLNNVGYYIWKMQYDSTIYPQGIPTPMMVLRGRRIWDPRLDPGYGGVGSQSQTNEATWTWTNNAALCLLDYLLGVNMNSVRIGGCGVPVTQIDIPSFVAAANVCDQSVSLSGGGSEARYTCNGFVDAIEDKLSVVNSMLQTMCGILIYNSGLISLIAGSAQTSVMTLTDSDLAGSLNINPSVSRQNKANTITSIYAEPAQLYQTVSSPQLSPSAYVTADGGIVLSQELQHRFTTSVATVQRINKLTLGNMREQLTIDAIYKPPAVQISAGNTFLFTSAAAGYTNQKMLCTQRELQEDGTVRIIARQETDAKYSWSTAEQLSPPSFNTMTVFDPTSVTAPSGGDVSVTGGNLVGANSSSVPVLILTCNAPPSPFVTSIITIYKLHTDTNWHSGPTIEPVRPPGLAYINGISPGVAYDVGFAYVTDFGVSAFTTVSSTTSGNNLIATGATAGSIGSAALANGAISALNKFAAGITPVEVLTSLPAVTGADNGRTAVLTTNGKIYRVVGGAWTNTVDGADIADFTVLPSKVLIGATDNLILDANTTNLAYWSSYSGPAPYLTAGYGGVGGAIHDSAITFNDNGVGVFGGCQSPKFTCIPGDNFFFQCKISNTGFSSHYYMFANTYDKTGGLIANNTLVFLNTVSGGFYTLSSNYVIPAGAAYVSLLFGGVRLGGGGYYVMLDPVVRRRVDATLIVDGSIFANHMTSNSVVAGTIAAGAINATAMIVNSLIVTGHLAAHGVTDSAAASNASGTASITVTIDPETYIVIVQAYFTNAGSGGVWDVLRDGSSILPFTAYYYFAAAIVWTDTPSSGSHTYSVPASAGVSTSIVVSQLKR